MEVRPVLSVWAYQACLMEPQNGNSWLGWVNRDSETPLSSSTKRNPSKSLPRGQMLSSRMSVSWGMASQFPAGMWHPSSIVYGNMTVRGALTICRIFVSVHAVQFTRPRIIRSYRSMHTYRSVLGSDEQSPSENCRGMASLGLGNQTARLCTLEPHLEVY
jgi:hypothetical protein